MRKRTIFTALLLLAGCNEPVSYPPAAVHGLEDVVALDFAVSGSATCARTSETDVTCVEAAPSGGLDQWDATSSSPIADMLHLGNAVCLVGADHHLECVRNDGSTLLTSDDVVQVSHDGCVRGAEGDVRCPLLFDGGWETVIESGASDIDFGGLGGGGDAFCAVFSGEVRCWQTRASADDTGRVVPGIDDAIDVEVGGDHSCALREGGTVACWGVNDHGQVGGPSITSDPIEEPITIEGIDDAVALGVGFEQSCALRSDGSVYCWGSIRQPGVEETPTPTRMAGVEDAIAVDDRCALTESGQILCWSEPRP